MLILVFLVVLETRHLDFHRYIYSVFSFDISGALLCLIVLIVFL